MQLPPLKLPDIPLPFEIPTLAHPPIDHFAVAIPVLVLLIEIVNLVAKKRAIGFIAFFLLIVGAVAAVAAYLSGLHDGKEVYDTLTAAGQEELKEHRLLGTYLMLASGVVLVFKLLSATIRRGLMKATYLLVLIVFVAGMLKQGKDGGELVYTYGANVERVQDIDSELFDTKEELEEVQEKLTAAQKELETLKTKAVSSEVLEAMKAKVATLQKALEEAHTHIKQLQSKTPEAPSPAPSSSKSKPQPSHPLPEATQPDTGVTTDHNVQSLDNRQLPTQE